MVKFVTLLTFKHAPEAHLLKTKLESGGIRAFVKNEYTAHIAPYHSEPAGPIKLQVNEQDVEPALQLLKKSGYIQKEKNNLKQSAFIHSLDLITLKIPGFRNKPLQLRLILAAAIILVLLTLIISLMILPSEQGF